MLIVVLVLVASIFAGVIQAGSTASIGAAEQPAASFQAEEAQLEAEGVVMRCLASLAPEDAAQMPNSVVITARLVDSEAEGEALTPEPAAC